VLRQYGTFLLNLLNDNSGQQYLDQAEQTERQRATSRGRTSGRHAQTHQAANAIFDVSMAVITISGDQLTLGHVLGANAGACTLFGRTTAELLGTTVQELLPATLATALNAVALRFVNGDVDASDQSLHLQHRMFALRKSGAVFPVTVTLRQISGGIQPAVFMAMVSEVPGHDQQHTVLYDSSNQRVFAVSSNAAALLNVIPHELDRSVSIDSNLLEHLLPGALEPVAYSGSHTSLAAGMPISRLFSVLLYVY